MPSDDECNKLASTENGASPDRLVSVLHYDGSPVTARFIARAISDLVAKFKIEKPAASAKEGALS